MEQAISTTGEAIGLHRPDLGGRLAKAEADAGYYARLIQDTDERLQCVKAATAKGTPPSITQQALEAHRDILAESRRQAEEAAGQIRAEMVILASQSHIQLSDVMLANWRAIQQRIEAIEASTQSNPLEFASRIAEREAIEKSIWLIEYQILRDLLITHEAMAAIKPVIESVFSAGIRAGLTESFEHFLIMALAGVDGIRPTVSRIAEAQEEIADRLCIPV